MDGSKPKKGPYPSAQESAKTAEKSALVKHRLSPSYKLAFQDAEFLLRDELRPTRVHLEILKPELILLENNVDSTVVFFGSSRIPDPESAARRLEEARERHRESPGDEQLAAALKLARKQSENSRYYDEARELSKLISQNTPNNEMVVITGGGPGIMEAANRGAYECGSRSIGLNIVLPDEQEPNCYINPELCFQFHYFATRKMHFLLRACGLVFFPGGYGTLDELFETLALLQTGKIRPIPLLLFGTDFWTRIVNFPALVEEGTISQHDLDLMQFVDSAEQAWEAIAKFNHVC
jgi:hypothetical protein